MEFKSVALAEKNLKHM